MLDFCPKCCQAISGRDTASNTSFPYPQALTASSTIRGLLTGTKTRVLGTSTFLYTVNFYDDRQRLVQVHSTNYTGGKDTVTTQYSFTGQVLRTLVCHQKAGTNTQQYRILTKMEYDAGGRLVKLYKKTGNSPEVILTETKYDELGQLQKKYIGKTRSSSNQNSYTTIAIDSLKYDYNARGWLRGINKDYARNENSANNWFGEELSYDYGFIQTYLNGNIAGIRWRSKGDGEQRAYGFTYDFVNRLAKANFTQLTNATWNTSAGIDFTLTIGDGSGVNSPVYDENGNFLNLLQKGLKLNSSVNIDSLTYGYNTNSNKLNYVTDSKNDVNTVLGDFKEVNNNSTQDYWYDGNGNLTKDLNKNISAIRYTHLNMPDSIAITGKGYIRYVYDANGVKLRKWVVDQTVTPNKITNTLYLGPFTYINDTLQYISQEEGRIRPKRAGYSDTMYYDYFEKDHLGNTRVVLTDELQKDMYPVASLETTPLNNEKIYYDRLDSGRVNKSTVPGYPTDTYTSPNDYIQKLRGNAVKVGASTLLKVMSGDKITVRVNSWYNLNGVSPSSPLSPLSDIVLALSGDIPATSAGKILASQVGGTVLNPQVTSFLNSRDASNTATNPKAYLNIVLLDEQLNPVITNDGKNSFFKQVSTNNSQETLSVTDREITKNGYVYIYVSNETPNVDVFFDNLQVTQTRGPLLDETHYYPFGLTMAGISSKAAGKIENRFKYNGIEEIGDFDLQDYDAQYRELDPQIGRWWEVDPKTDAMESWSPYASNYDNPITYKDPLGDAPGDDDDESFLDKLKSGAKSLAGSATGLLVGGVDNVFGTNIRGTVAPSITDPAFAGGWNAGLNTADAASIVGGVVESGTGDGLLKGSAIVTGATGGLSLEVTAPSAGLGAFMTLHGVFVTANGSRNLTSQNGRVEIQSNTNSSAQQRADKLNKTDRSGKDFTKAGKETVKDSNKEKNNGEMVCENCGVKVKNGKRHTTGETPPSNEAHVDHIKRKRDGGRDNPDNGQVLCRGCNLDKH